jgi:hypothetical protein
MNKLIGNIEKINVINMTSTIFKSDESIFISKIYYGESSEDVVLNYFYKIKSKKNFVDVFSISGDDSAMLIDVKLYDYNNMCARSPISRDNLLLNRKNLCWGYVQSPLVFLEAFPFLEKEIRDWIVLFAENREISKHKVYKELISFFKNKK